MFEKLPRITQNFLEIWVISRNIYKENDKISRMSKSEEVRLKHARVHHLVFNGILSFSDCEVPQTCFLDDFVTTENFEPRLMLGTWHLVAKQLPEALATFHAYQIQFSYLKSHRYAFKLIGEKK